MNTFQNSLVIAFIVIISACKTQVKFPISSVTPAAILVAQKGIDNQKNHTLTITAEKLASPDRLDPPGSNYSVWIVTKLNGIKNVGQLNVKNAIKTTFSTTTAFDFYEVFITVENQGNLNYPLGKEIARVKI